MLKRISTFLVLLLIAGGTLAGNFVERPRMESTLYFSGEISAGDDVTLSAWLEKKKRQGAPINYLRLFVESSPGGDIDAAMKLGRIIRREQISFSGMHCYSACVLLLAGAVRRSEEGFTEVGVHRPYRSQLAPGESDVEIKARFTAARESINKYLEEMNVSQELASLMFSVPPGRLKILKQGELERLGLASDDPVYEESKTAKAAGCIGISSAEYRRREAVADRTCAEPQSSTTDFSKGGHERFLARMNDYGDCHRAIKWGIHPRFFPGLEKRAREACSSFDVDSPQRCNCLRKELTSGK